jgi:hypothetical protein
MKVVRSPMKTTLVRRKVLPIVCAILLCLGSFAVQAAPIRLVFPQIDGLIEEDGSGIYQRLLAEAVARAGVSYSADVFPKARALSLFLAKKYDGIFTYTQTARERFGKGGIIASYPIGAYRGFVFRIKGDPPVTDFGELAGKPVGGIVGFEGTYGSAVRAGAVLDLAVSDASNISKLRLRRVFAMLGFLPDLFPELQQLSYSPTLPFFESYDRFTLFNTPENRRFLAPLSSAIEKLHADGSARRLVGPAYMAVSGSFPMDE